MYANGKMRPTENSSRNGGEGIKENDGVNPTMTNCKKFFKCHKVPPIQQ
jgi:hypothetical protein